MRRQTWAALLVSALSLGAAALILLRPEPDPPPNVLVLLWDTARADRMSLYGHDRPTTPRMAAWAERGIVYERAISPAMWTVPAHASLFTGLAPSTHGASAEPWLDSGHVTLAEWFGEHGYDTWAFSANPNLTPSRVNLLQGFDSVDTAWDERWRDQIAEHTRRKLLPHDQSTEISPGRPDARQRLGVANAAPAAHRALISWLERRPDDRPFLAYVSYMEAHKPRVPTAWARRKVADPDVVAQGLRTDVTFPRQLAYSYGSGSFTPDELEAIRSVYDASLADLDDATSDLLIELEWRGWLDDTIVVFTSDHGEQLGEHHLMGHRHGVFQELLHVPLVIAWPGRLEPARVARPVGTIELFSTLLELCGLRPPSTPLARGDLTDLRRGAQTLFAEAHRIDLPGLTRVATREPGADLRRYARTYEAIFEDGWKLVVAHRQGEEVERSCFDLEADPAEQSSACLEHPDRAVRLEAARARWRAGRPPRDRALRAPGEGPTTAAPDLREHLELLGYVE